MVPATKNNQLLADGSLLGVTVIWGATFSLVKQWLEVTPVFQVVTFRFLQAFLVLLLIFLPRLRKVDGYTLCHSALTGLFLFLTIAFQTAGLQYTTASNSGFIIGLAVVFIPFFEYLLFRRKIKPILFLGLIFALCGLFLITVDLRDLAQWSPNLGDFYTLICTIFAAFQIIWISKMAGKVDPRPSAVIQMGVVGVPGSHLHHAL